MGCSSISVRGLAAIAAVCALLCIGAAAASAAPLVWTANSSEESVSTFSSATGQAVGSPIPVGDGPNSIAITPNGKRAVVTSVLGNDVTVIETATRTPIGTIPLGSHAKRVAISPDGKTAYVTDESDDHVYVIDVETAKSGGSFPVGPEAVALAFSPSGTRAFVGIETGIVVVETATSKVVGEPIELDGEPESIVLTPDGETIYAAVVGSDKIAVIDTALDEVVENIPLSDEPNQLAVSPDGQRLYASTESGESVTVIDTSTDEPVGTPIKVGKEPKEIAFTPNGKTAYVAVGGEGVVQSIDTATGKLGTPIKVAGKGVAALIVAPDQSPTAAFTAPSAIVGTPAIFSGAASSDPDGTVASYSWAFGDGGLGGGVGPSHTYNASGTYGAKLSVVDNEGCGEEEVFTGRTAYCSGNVGASVTHPVTVKAPPVEPITAPAPPSNKFAFGRLVHNRHNGTARLQVKLPSAGFVLLFGKKVHAVTRKSKGVQSMWLTIHARVELNKRLKEIFRAPVRVRVTFTPNGGTPKTVYRTVTLQRNPRHKGSRR